MAAGPHQPQHRRVDHAPRLVVERHVQRDHVALRKHAGQVAALDIRREVAVDDVRIARDHASEYVAADVGHPLPDPPEPDDAQCERGRAADPAGREVVPPAGADVAVVGHHVAHGGERQRQGMRRDLPHAIVRRIGHPHAVPGTGGGVDRVEAGADPAHDADLGQPREDAIGDGRVLQQDPAAAPGRGHDLVLGPALREHELHPGGFEQPALELDIGEVVIGEENAGHTWSAKPGRNLRGPLHARQAWHAL